MRLLRFVRVFSMVAFVVAGALGGVRAATPASAVAGDTIVVPIDGTVDAGMAHLVQRAVTEANATHARALVLDVNTPGGLVSAAFDIRDAMFAAQVPTVAYISQRAYSAGALISLSARTIVMAPGSSIGAAEPIPNDPKHVSALRAEFASTAARNHRSPILAAAMVDKSIDVPGVKRPGSILSFTAAEALHAHISDATAPSLEDALRDAHVAAGPLRHVDYSFAEALARFATSPEVSGILLSIGVLGLLIELQTLHGIAGLVGVAALALFFGTHVYAGFSNGLVIALALAGIVGIVLELHVIPGTGVAGPLGALALAAAVVLAFGTAFFAVAAQAISIAIVLSVVAFLLVVRFLPHGIVARRLGFRGSQGADYVASEDHRDLIGRAGVATSYLRPAGVASVDGRRVDVLTEGDFVPAGSHVVVSRVEGARIFVHAIPSEET
jgi:membrane-bound serine protease (ClpP class)